MSDTLLTEKPISGTIRERHYNVRANANLWVRFDDVAGEPWVGVFGLGGTSPYCTLVPFEDDEGQTVLVVAGGQGYIVNRTSGRLVRKTDWSNGEGVLAAPTRDFVVVADNLYIWVCRRENDVLVQRAEEEEGPGVVRVALDGIALEQSTDNALAGYAWYVDGWYRFRLSYDDMRVRLGERIKGDVQGAYGGFSTVSEYLEQMRRYHLV